MKITIDGKECEARQGQTVLQAAREHLIDIPTLCNNEAIEPYGACRLCLVEVQKNGRKKLVTSCLYPVEEGLVVETANPKVTANRRMIMQLLLARCPNNTVIQDMAKRIGVTETPFQLEDKNCILCGLCTRACEEVVGASAISLVNRGVNRQVAGPFYKESETCIGCGSCVYVCPVGAITMEDKGDTRILSMPSPEMEKITFKLKKCNKCGAYWAPEKQLEFICKTTGQSMEIFDLCPDCRD